MEKVDTRIVLYHSYRVSNVLFVQFSAIAYIGTRNLRTMRLKVMAVRVLAVEVAMLSSELTILGLLSLNFSLHIV